MMEVDGDDFGTLYSNIVEPCSSVKEPNFFNDPNPSNFHATSDFSANAYKNLEEYDRFLLSECGGDGEKLLFECKVDDEFDDVIFDVEMEQKEAEFDGRSLDGDNEVNVLVDMMDEENDNLEPENLRNSTNDDSIAEEPSESDDESFDIIIDDYDLNKHNVGSAEKYAEKKELGLLRVGSLNDLDNLDDLEPGEIAGMKAELRTHVEARVGYQSFQTESKGVRSVFLSQTIDADSKAEQNQVNPVHNAEYNYGSTRFRYLPVHFRKAFSIEDTCSGYKPWKRPGVNLSDYFNFDLDEENWQNYCKQMKQLLQTSLPSKAVGNKSEQLQSRNIWPQQTGKAIQVLISHGERVSCLQNHHPGGRDSDAIIEIVLVDSPDDTESFTKDLKGRALHDYKKRPTTIHKIINGDMILPFPLDGSFHRIYHEERTSHQLSIHYAQEGIQWTDFESMVSKKQGLISCQDWSMDLDHPEEKSEPEQGLRGALVQCDKVMPLYSTTDVRKSNEGETKVRNRLEDDCFHNSGEKSRNNEGGKTVRKRLEDDCFHNGGEKRRRQGDSNYKKSLKQPDESTPTVNVHDNQEKMGNGFDNCIVRMQETFSQTNHQERNDNNKLNKGRAVVEENCRMRIENTLSSTDHQEGNNDSMLNKESAVNEDNCKMGIEETLSQTDHQKGNNDNKLNKGSAVDVDNCRIRIYETLWETDQQEGNSDDKLNKGSPVDVDNCRMRIKETLSQIEHNERNNDNKSSKGSAVDVDNCRMIIDETSSETDHQEGKNDNKLNKGSAVDEDNCKMRIEETLSQTEHQEGNNDNKLNKGSAVDEDKCRMRIEETSSDTDHQEGNNDNKCNKGRAVNEDNGKMRKEETLSKTDHLEGNNDNKLNKVDEDNCRMKIEETLSEADHQEGNNDNKLNKESAVDEDFNGKQLTEPIDKHEQEFPDNCNLVTNLGNDVIFDDQEHEAKRVESMDEVQGSPKAIESCRDEMKQLMANIKVFMSEVDELVYGHKHEHRICCLR